MKINNLKIGSLLRIGFTFIIILVIILGTITYFQSLKIHQQTETIYNHPLLVTRSVGNFNADILTILIETRNLMLTSNDQEKKNALHIIELCYNDAENQIKIISDQYLGPRKDVENAKKSFLSWKIAREEVTQQILSGQIEKAKENISSTGKVGIYKEKLLNDIKIIHDFAEKKGDDLYANSDKTFEALQNQMALIVIIILILLGIIMYFLLQSIRKPLKELEIVTYKFHKGDYSVRSNNKSNNEFGILSKSFNNMAEGIEKNIELNKKSSNLSTIMMSEDDAEEFFKITLGILSEYTNSQISAVYLLSIDKKSYKHFVSIGLDQNVRKSFDAVHFEGEFGKVLSSGKLQHIKNINKDTQFNLNTINGSISPKEIVTFPLKSGKDIIAVISLASINEYDTESIKLIENLIVTFSARVEGILSYRKLKVFTEKLEEQNRELESQKTEMEAQSLELTEQNTELEMQKKQLNEVNRLKTNFLSNMSHELRTPLNSVIALSGVLNRRLANKIPEEEYSYIDVIERNGKLLLSLINEILDLSRIESGKEEVIITSFNMNNLISGIIEMINPQAVLQNINLIHINKDANLKTMNDLKKCRQILQNLIANAVKFTEKGKVEISAVLKGNNIEINISDTGIGIAEEHLEHIFDEFRQADGSTSRRFGGTGLGLAIAKKYANLLGGKITVKSELGKGSEFILSLPLIYSEENIKTEKIYNDIQKTKNRKLNLQKGSDSLPKTILLVEDSEASIIQIKDIFEEHNYKILVAKNGGEALEILSKTIPDAMILDLMMPGINGFDLLKSIREFERTAAIPVLILTAKHITKEELSFLTSNNIHELIQKGDVNRTELLIALETMVNPIEIETNKIENKYQKIDGKPKVLIVEDNSDNMLTIKAILNDDYILIEAVDGNEALIQAEKHKPNLILMDIALPELNGIEAFQAIKKDNELKHIPVIAVTASALNAEREIILKQGFDAYIPKPIDEKLFFKTINEILYGN